MDLVLKHASCRLMARPACADLMVGVIVLSFPAAGWIGRRNRSGRNPLITPAVQDWAVDRKKAVTYVHKGQHPLTEHYRCAHAFKTWC